MKTNVKKAFLVPALIVGLNLVPASRVSAQTFTTLHSFTAYPERTNPDGANPYAGLLTNSSGDILYGTARGGGSSGNGTVFAMNTNGTGFTILHSFTVGSDGANPYAGLISLGNTLYGTAYRGGGSGKGTLFAVHADGTSFTILHSFTGGSDGANPYAGLLLSGNTLYGTAFGGGSSNKGTVFAVQTDGTGFTTLHHFTGGSDGAGPPAGLILSGNTLYGTALTGGSSGKGTVFAVNTNGTGFTALHSFTGSDGDSPDAGLIVAGNILYGTTSGGGWGTVFALHTDGTGFTNLHYFDIVNGAFPSGLMLAGDTLYGTAENGGIAGWGTIFAVNTDGTGFTNVHKFNGAGDGANPYAGLIISGSILYGTASEGGSSTAGTVFAVNTDGTGFTNLHSFAALSDPVYTNSDGADPLAGLIANASGNTLYGTAQRGGSSGYGTVFAVNTDGSGFTTLHSFTSLNNNANSDGAYPEAGVILSGNTLYGVAALGGSSGNGTVFAVHTDGSGFTTLHSFTAATYNGSCCNTNGDGANPAAGLVVLGDTLFGAAHSGGSSSRGTVFKLNTDGSGFTNLHSFTALNPTTGFNSDGAGPNGLILSGNTLYGTAGSGGSSGVGTVFKVNTNGTGFTTLHSFTVGPCINCPDPTSDGANPAGLLLSGNILYGAAKSGGSGGAGTVFAINTDGTGFTNLHSFAPFDFTYFTNSDGFSLRGLTLSGNTLYGTALQGGSANRGTMFVLNTDGSTFTNLHNFTGGSDGSAPTGGLIASGNALYGTAQAGGSADKGAVFSLSFRPQLTITPSGLNVILTWPANVAGFDYTGYTLQSATNLGSVWSTNSSAPVVIDGQNIVTNPISGAQKFYRLVQ